MFEGKNNGDPQFHKARTSDIHKKLFDNEVNRYLELGFSLIPLVYGEKSPIIPWENYQHKKMTRQDWDTICGQKNVNVGIVCGEISNLVVIDVDSEAFSELIEKTLTVKTARGYHFYLRMDKPSRSFKIENNGVHIDIKGEGGYVVAPPSLHPTGWIYKFIDRDKPILHIDSLADMGIEAPRKMEFPPKDELKVKPWSQLPPEIQTLFNPAIEGEREDRAHRIAATLLNRWRLPKETTLTWLDAWNETNEPPLEEKELHHAMETAEKGGYVYNLDKLTKSNGQKEDSNNYFVQERFMPRWLAEEILAEYHFVTMRDNTETYIYENGVYILNGESVIAEVAQKKLQDRIRTRHVSEVIDYIHRATYKDRDIFNQSLHLINLRNGVLDLQTEKLEPHSPSYHFLQQLPIEYDATAECPNIEKFLSEVVPDEKDREAIIQFIGYCLYRSYPIQKAFMLVGDGANGKSTLINVIKAFLGPENVSTRSLQDLESNRFAKADLYGKLTNLFADLSDLALRTAGTFKMLTGGDIMCGERKFHNSFSFINHAKLIFSANKAPKSPDDTNAFLRRWSIVNFPNTFQADKADIKLDEKLTTQSELSGLLNKAIRGLKKLLESRQFANEKGIDATREEYARKSDSVKAFVLDMIEVAPKKWVDKKGLYTAYCEYCRIRNYPAVSSDAFYKRIAHEVTVEDYRPKVNGERVYAWKGIALRNSECQNLSSFLP